MTRSIVQLFLFSCILLAGISGCEAPQKDWPDKVRGIFGKKTQSPHLIFLIPEDEFTSSFRPPLLVVPAGEGFDNFIPLAFLPDDEPKGAKQQKDDNGDDEQEENEDQETDEPDEDEENGNDPEDGDDTGSLFDSWPPSIGPWLNGDDNDDSEDDLDKELDKALEDAFGDEEPPPLEDEDEDPNRFRFRFYTPTFPVPFPDWWWDPDIDIPDDPELPDFDFELPRWKDLEDDNQRPPYWPLDEPWPPRDYRLPDKWKPLDDGYKYGKWRIYIHPIQPN